MTDLEKVEAMRQAAYDATWDAEKACQVLTRMSEAKDWTRRPEMNGLLLAAWERIDAIEETVRAHRAVLSQGSHATTTARYHSFVLLHASVAATRSVLGTHEQDYAINLLSMLGRELLMMVKVRTERGEMGEAS